ncbi:MAG: DNA-directed DNA polymerase [Candidatus Diapherotrites archaeon]|nr:DNA-directed DNA polymerase [Candidatus Diapherotrites archaeon]
MPKAVSEHKKNSKGEKEPVKGKVEMKKGLLLDASYFDDEEKGKSIIKLFIKIGKKGGKKNAPRRWFFDSEFRPHFFVLSGKANAEKTIKELEGLELGDEEKFRIFRAEKTSLRAWGRNETNAVKVSFDKVSHLVQARKLLKDLGFEIFEYDVPFGKRYLLDKRLNPCGFVDIEFEPASNEIKKITPSNEIVEPMRDIEAIAFDLETYCGKKFAIGAEPIIMASMADMREELGRVISYKTKKVKGLELVESEEKVINEIEKGLNEADLIVTYNGDNFDFHYVKERAKKLGAEFKINGVEPRIIRKGLDNAAKLSGVQHIDSYQIMRFLQRTGAIHIVKLDIENVSEKVFGEKKEKVYPLELNEAWENGKGLERMVDYNLKDSIVAMKIAKEYLPLFMEISKLTSQTLFDTTRSATSSMVEDLLMKEAHHKGFVAPNKPNEFEVRERIENPIKGAFVKEPLVGLHENIAVLDFASLYPSIIVSHNISPETLNCEHEECKKNVSPDGTWFCKKEKGLFPEVLGGLVTERIKLKREYGRKKAGGEEAKVLFSSQWALKIVLNSAYGYLAYPRARWYSRECASAITAWARNYIHETIRKAGEADFEVLYTDTDSTFLLMKRKTKRDVEEFVEKINKELPGNMELEVDGYYRRGIFVTRRKKEGGVAKKRYALMDEKGNLKIVGFEYVRRDWCNIAKETQRTVIDMVLHEGDSSKAADYVRKVIKDLKSGKVPKKELAIITMLKRKVDSYDAKEPHVSAAKKAIAQGTEIEVGTILSYVITKNGKSISDRAELEEFVEEGNYDADYYIQNQVLPAVIKIMEELGYSKEDLIHGGKQTGLNTWG